MIDPNNFKPVPIKRLPRKTEPELTISSGSMNLNPVLVDQLLEGLEVVDITPAGNKRFYVELEYSRTDKAFRISLGTQDNGFLFLTNASRSRAPRLGASRGIPNAFRLMEVKPGAYVRKFPEQPNVYVLDVSIPKK